MPNFKKNTSPAMKKSAYKMKGSPMQRNFGIGSPLTNKTGKTLPVTRPSLITKHAPDANNSNTKGTVKGITNFEYDFPKTNKAIDLHNKVIKKGINTIKKGGKKVYDYFTKK